MDPVASQYQTDPWEPNVDPTNPDSTSYDDEAAAAAAYTAVYGGTPTSDPDPTDTPLIGPVATMPTLALAYTIPPDLLPSKPTLPSNQPPKLPDYNPFNIYLGALWATEQTFLQHIQSMISSYDDLRGQVTAAINDPNMFGQNAGSWSPSAGDATIDYFWTPDPLNDEGAKFADSMNTQMSETVQGLAVAIETLGSFAACLNTTGQFYTYTDSINAFPERT